MNRASKLWNNQHHKFCGLIRDNAYNVWPALIAKDVMADILIRDAGLSAAAETSVAALKLTVIPQIAALTLAMVLTL